MDLDLSNLWKEYIWDEAFLHPNPQVGQALEQEKTYESEERNWIEGEKLDKGETWMKQNCKLLLFQMLFASLRTWWSTTVCKI